MARAHLTKQAFLQDCVESTRTGLSANERRCPVSFFAEHRSNCSRRTLIFVVFQANFQLLDRFVDRVHRFNAMTAEVVGGMLEIFARRAQ